MSFTETDGPVLIEGDGGVDPASGGAEVSGANTLRIDQIDEQRFLTDAAYVKEISDLAKDLDKGPEKTAIYIYLEELLMQRVFVGVMTKVVSANTAQA